jgi:hypothetical protein
MTGVHIYDPPDSITYRHTAPLATTSSNGLATWQGHTDPLTGERVLTAWALPNVPARY